MGQENNDKNEIIKITDKSNDGMWKKRTKSYFVNNFLFCRISIDLIGNWKLKSNLISIFYSIDFRIFNILNYFIIFVIFISFFKKTHTIRFFDSSRQNNTNNSTFINKFCKDIVCRRNCRCCFKNSCFSVRKN